MIIANEQRRDKRNKTYFDDCDAWGFKNSNSNIYYFNLMYENKQMDKFLKIILVNSKIVLQDLTPQLNKDRVAILHQYTSILKVSNLKRQVS